MRWVPLVLLLAVAPAEGRPRAVDVELSSADPRAAAAELLGPGAELREVQTRRSLTGTHVRFRTLAVDGARVLGRDAAVHLDGDFPRYRARLVDDRGRGLWTVVGRRRVGEEEAARIAGAAAGGIARSAERVAIPLGPYLARPGWRVLVDVEAPRRLLEVVVDADDGGAEVGRNLLRRVSGTGWVYRPNPVTVSGDHGLRDMNDGDSTTLTDLREQVTLEGLDGTGFLRGEFVDVRVSRFRVQETSLVFDYTRSEDGFEQVNTYHHIDRTQRFLQSLGYTGAKGILHDRPFLVRVNMLSEDNSYFDSGVNEIQTGTGGVDDAEDGDILVHEYGHAVQEAIVPGFGSSDDASAIGEGWSDIQAYAVPTGSSKAPGVPRTCLASWDAVAYATPADCLRRVDGPKHYPEHLHVPEREEHFDGEIWSATLFEIISATGLGPVDGYQLSLEAQFDYSADVSFIEAGEALISADERLYGGAHASAIRRVLIWRGLWSGLAQPAKVDESKLAPVTVSHRSPSPIANNADGQIVIDRPGAQAIRVHFSKLDFEEGNCLGGGSECDAVYLYDRAGDLYARFGGQSADKLSPIVPGDRVVVRWVTTPTVPSGGMEIDRLDVLMGPVIPDAGVPDAGVSDARPGRPGTGDTEGGCRVGGSPSLVWLFAGWLLVFLRRRAT